MKRTGRTLNDSNAAESQICGAKPCVPLYTEGTETKYNELVLFFIHPAAHSKGIGQAAWKAIEQLHPETEVWETCTPYFEKRNIHFYLNRCGFHIVEFFHSKHPDPNSPEEIFQEDTEGGEMFRFEKVMKI